MKKQILLTTALLSLLAFTQPSLARSSDAKASPKSVMQAQNQSVNLNAAGAKELADALTGVGLKKAQAIVEYRNTHGKFKKIEELANVKGIGIRTLEKNKQKIVFK